MIQALGEKVEQSTGRVGLIARSSYRQRPASPSAASQLARQSADDSPLSGFCCDGELGPIKGPRSHRAKRQCGSGGGGGDRQLSLMKAHEP